MDISPDLSAAWLVELNAMNSNQEQFGRMRTISMFHICSQMRKLWRKKMFLQFLFLQRIKMGVEASKSGGVFAFFLLQISTMKKTERMAEDPILRRGFFF